MSTLRFEPSREPGNALRWGVAALLVAGFHAGAGWWLVGHGFAPPPPPEGVAGVIIDLEPVAVPAPPPDVAQPLETAGPAPTPQVAEAPPASPAASALPAAEPASPAEAAVVPPPPAGPVPPAQPVPEPPPAPLLPVLVPEAPTPSDAVLAPMPPTRPAVPQPPKPKPVLAQPIVVKPAFPKPDPRRVAREEARQAADAAARQQRRAARTEARAAQVRQGGGESRESAAPTPATSGAAVSSWRGDVVAHLNAYKPASPNGAAGTVRVAFTVDRGGRVTSASVAGSSGDETLDAAAVAMVRRASPVPAPPPELGGRIGLGVPVHFR